MQRNYLFYRNCSCNNLLCGKRRQYVYISIVILTVQMGKRDAFNGRKTISWKCFRFCATISFTAPYKCVYLTIVVCSVAFVWPWLLRLYTRGKPRIFNSFDVKWKNNIENENKTFQYEHKVVNKNNLVKYYRKEKLRHVI